MAGAPPRASPVRPWGACAPGAERAVAADHVPRTSPATWAALAAVLVVAAVPAALGPPGARRQQRRGRLRRARRPRSPATRRSTPLFPIFRAHPLLFQSLLSVPWRLGGHVETARVHRGAARRRDRLRHLPPRAGCSTAPRPGSWPALLLAVMPYHVVVSRQVLLDGPMTLCATLSLYLLARFAATAQARVALRRRRGDGADRPVQGDEHPPARRGLRVLRARARGAGAPAPGPAGGRRPGRDHRALPRRPAPRRRQPLGRRTTWPGSSSGGRTTPSVLPVGGAAGDGARSCSPSPSPGSWLLRRRRSWRETLLLCLDRRARGVLRALAGQGLPVPAARPRPPPPCWPRGRSRSPGPPGRAARGRPRPAPGRRRPRGRSCASLLAVSSCRPDRALCRRRSLLAGSGGLPGGREAGRWIGAHVPPGAQLMTIGPSMANILAFYGHRRACGLSVSPNPLSRNPSYEPIDNPDLAIREARDPVRGLGRVHARRARRSSRAGCSATSSATTAACPRGRSPGAHAGPTVQKPGHHRLRAAAMRRAAVLRALALAVLAVPAAAAPASATVKPAHPDRALRRAHAGGPLVRQLLRHLPGRRRDPEGDVHARRPGAARRALRPALPPRRPLREPAPQRARPPPTQDERRADGRLRASPRSTSASPTRARRWATTTAATCPSTGTSPTSTSSSTASSRPRRAAASRTTCTGSRPPRATRATPTSSRPAASGASRRSSTGSERAACPWKFYVQDYDPSITFRSNGRDGPTTQATWMPLLSFPRYVDDPDARRHIVDLSRALHRRRPRNAAVRRVRRPGELERAPARAPAGRPAARPADRRLDAAQPAVAARSAFLWTYDTWGGWYDHVRPPKGRGFRVPALLVSAWARRHHVDHTPLDTTSALRFIEVNWRLPALAPDRPPRADVHRRLRLLGGPAARR